MSNVSDIGGVYHWSISKLAEAFGIDRRTVKSRLAEARVPVVGNVRGSPVFELKEAAPALFRPTSSLDPDDLHNPNTMPPKERKDWYDSEKGRVWLEKELRQLIPEHEVTSVYAAAIKAVVQQLETLPDRLERDAGMMPKDLAMVQNTIDDLREALFAQTYQASASAIFNRDEEEIRGDKTVSGEYRSDAEGI
ncbi:DUF1441 family protein [Enterobacter sp. A103]|uniref:DUF1441 family protein n=1 Tax=Enterobacter sp. A103 TaxID=3102785 RepID=UPI002ACA7099|nr:DUF1441 family protein [Enterobacter sp. A103]MDZ5641658.1 DUF1441 family protein [Enterobacter sp. A103]